MTLLNVKTISGFVNEILVIYFTIIFAKSGIVGSPTQEQGRDHSSGLCPTSYPKLVVYNATGQCHQVGQRGPCNDLMQLVASPDNSNYGECVCDRFVENCAARPIIQWPSSGQCFYAFEQGPCGAGEWLIVSQGSRSGRCEQRPLSCQSQEGETTTANPQTFDDDVEGTTTMKVPVASTATDKSNEHFWFVHNGTCYQTGTTGFCTFPNQLYFLGDGNLQCVHQPVFCRALALEDYY